LQPWMRKSQGLDEVWQIYQKNPYLLLLSKYIASHTKLVVLLNDR
jgi:hypothetical protein